MKPNTNWARLAYLAMLHLPFTIATKLWNDDACMSAKTLELDGKVFIGSTKGLSPSSSTKSSCGPLRDEKTPAVWYTFRGQGRRVTITTCGESTDFFTSLSSWKGSCNENGSLHCILGSFGDFGCSSPNGASVTFDALEGETYSILVSGRKRNDTGSFQISANQGKYIPNIGGGDNDPSQGNANVAVPGEAEPQMAQVVCSDDEDGAMVASLSIITERNAEFIDVFLTDITTNETIWNSVGGVYASHRVYHFEECLDPSRCYRFSIGVGPFFGDSSSYTFTFNHKYVTSHNDNDYDDGEHQHYYFGDGCSGGVVDVSTKAPTSDISSYNLLVDSSGSSFQEILAMVMGIGLTVLVASLSM